MQKRLRNAAILIPTTALLTFGGLPGAFAAEETSTDQPVGVEETVDGGTDLDTVTPAPSETDTDGTDIVVDADPADPTVDGEVPPTTDEIVTNPTPEEDLGDFDPDAEFITPDEMPVEWDASTTRNIVDLFDRLNDDRVAQGLEPVQFNFKVSKAAQFTTEESIRRTAEAGEPIHTDYISPNIPEGFTSSALHAGFTADINKVFQDPEFFANQSDETTHVGISIVKVSDEYEGNFAEGYSYTVVSLGYPEDAVVEGTYGSAAQAFEAEGLEIGAEVDRTAVEETPDAPVVDAPAPDGDLPGPGTIPAPETPGTDTPAPTPGTDIDLDDPVVDAPVNNIPDGNGTGEGTSPNDGGAIIVDENGNVVDPNSVGDGAFDGVDPTRSVLDVQTCSDLEGGNFTVESVYYTEALDADSDGLACEDGETPGITYPEADPLDLSGDSDWEAVGVVSDADDFGDGTPEAVLADTGVNKNMGLLALFGGLLAAVGIGARKKLS